MLGLFFNFLSLASAQNEIFLPLVAVVGEGITDCSRELSTLYKSEINAKDPNQTLEVINKSTGYTAYDMGDY